MKQHQHKYNHPHSLTLHLSKQTQSKNVTPKKTSQFSSINAAFVPQSAHGLPSSSATFSLLGSGSPSNLSKHIYQIVRRRQRATCSNLEKIQGPPKPKHQHCPRHNLHLSPMIRTTQKRHRLPSFHKANVHGDQPQSIQQRHRLLSSHKANIHGDHPLQPPSHKKITHRSK